MIALPSHTKELKCTKLPINCLTHSAFTDARKVVQSSMLKTEIKILITLQIKIPFIMIKKKSMHL